MPDTMNKFMASRKASGLTIDKASELANMSRVSYINREKNPEMFRLSELRGIYEGMTDVAKPILVEAITDIFLP